MWRIFLMGGMFHGVVLFCFVSVLVGLHPCNFSLLVPPKKYNFGERERERVNVGCRVF